MLTQLLRRRRIISYLRIKSLALATALLVSGCYPAKTVVVVDPAHKAPPTSSPVEPQARSSASAAPVTPTTGKPAVAAAQKKKVATTVESPAPTAPPPAPSPSAPAVESPEAAEIKIGSGAVQPPPPVRPEPSATLAWPSPAEFDQRFTAYSAKLSRWQEVGAQLAAADGAGQPPAGWSECSQKVEELAAGYRKLRDGLAPGGSAVNGGTFWQLHSQDLAFLEGDCPTLFRTASETLNAPRVVPPPAVPPEEKGKEIGKLVGQGKYQEALAAYETLRQSAPAVAQTHGPRQAYGLALLHTGRVEGAIEVLAKELGGLEGDEQGGLWRQHQLVADLMTAAGRQAEAKAIYLKLADYFAAIERESLWVADQLAVLETTGKEAKGLTLYQSMLRTYLTSDGRRVPEALATGATRLESEFAGSHLARSGRALVKRAEEQVAGYVRRQIAVAATQVQEKSAKQALATLTELQVGLPPELSEMVQKAMDEARQAEKSELEAKSPSADQGQAQQWTEANHLLELQKYDEAIQIFRGLEGGEFGERARVKQLEAANLAAAALRREAAVLFSKAAKVSDPAQQSEALQASRRLLEQITSKYPNSDLIGKVKQNLKIIEEQLGRLAPAATPAAAPRTESGAAF